MYTFRQSYLEFLLLLLLLIRDDPSLSDTSIGDSLFLSFPFGNLESNGDIRAREHAKPDGMPSLLSRTRKISPFPWHVQVNRPSQTLCAVNSPLSGFLAWVDLPSADRESIKVAASFAIARGTSRCVLCPNQMFLSKQISLLLRKCQKSFPSRKRFMMPSITCAFQEDARVFRYGAHLVAPNTKRTYRPLSRVTKRSSHVTLCFSDVWC